MAARTLTETLPEFGIEMRTAALYEGDRRWVPLQQTKYRRVIFSSYEQAEEFLVAMQQSQPHVSLRIEPLE